MACPPPKQLEFQACEHCLRRVHSLAGEAHEPEPVSLTVSSLLLPNPGYFTRHSCR